MRRIVTPYGIVFADAFGNTVETAEAVAAFTFAGVLLDIDGPAEAEAIARLALSHAGLLGGAA